MNEKEKESFDPKPVLENWLKAATDFWGPVIEMWSAASGKTDTSMGQEGGRAKKNLESALRSWKAMSAAMSEPETGKSIFEGIRVLPDIVSKMTQTGWDGYLKLQQQWYERLLRAGQATEAYSFDNLDQSWRGSVFQQRGRRAEAKGKDRQPTQSESEGQWR